MKAATHSFRPCVVIPTYNNPGTIERVVREALRHVNDVIVVNDGSGPEGTSAVRALEGLPGVQVLHRATNGGKGRAVKDGLARAASCGFTHALQIDADGQHALDDMPRFLQTAREAPHALVLGTPRFDDSVPKSRLFGRKITIFWSAIETGGRVISDPMCGFRVYPVAAALEAMARGNYMDFDPEIAVKMVWQGAPVINLETPVRYLAAEEGGISSFRLVKDNVRISWMHTRLVFGALWRLLAWPWRAWVRSKTSARPWHRIPEAGNAWGIRLLATLCRWLGRAPARALLVFIVGYYALVRPSARRASRLYLQRMGVSSNLWAVYLHLLRFAQCALDRFFFLTGDFDRFEVSRFGHEYLVELAEQKRGAILLGAHLGSFEALRAMARDTNMPIAALGYFDNTEMLNRELDRAGANRTHRFVRMVPGSLQHLFEVKELIEQGHAVALLGDRCLGERGTEVEFLGAPARFPIGPYAMAAALECPIFITLGLHFPPNRYELYLEPFMARVPKRREDKTALDRCAQQFARRLEHYCRRAPDNWFNFYDFWEAAAVFPESSKLASVSSDATKKLAAAPERSA